MDMFISSTEPAEEPSQVDSKKDYSDTEKTSVKHSETTHIDISKYGIIKTKENKSTRVQLLCKPSVIASLDEIAKAYNTSRNEIINGLLENFIKQNEKGDN